MPEQPFRDEDVVWREDQGNGLEIILTRVHGQENCLREYWRFTKENRVEYHDLVGPCTVRILRQLAEKNMPIAALQAERDRMWDALNLILYGKLYTQDADITEREIEEIVKECLCVKGTRKDTEP